MKDTTQSPLCKHPGSIRATLRVSALVSLFAFVSIAEATVYYVDSVAGQDANSGTSTSTPWKSLGKVNSTPLSPGDQVLFKAGSAWTGTLVPGYSGSATGQIVFGRYGTGPKPILNGGGSDQTIHLYNVDYITIRDLDITNPAPSGNALRNGIRLTAKDSRVLHGIKILNNDIHHVIGMSTRAGNALYRNAAIFIVTDDTSAANPVSGFSDLTIEGNYIYEISTIGIYMRGSEVVRNWEVPHLWAPNVKIRSNVFDRTGADHIVIGQANAPVIEYNAGYDAGVNGGGYEYIAGMWASYFCKDAVFQFNEVARTKNEKTTMDGDSQAFDVDKGALGTTVFQYNYSHDNAGGVLLVMPDTSRKNVIFRYNISQNDHHHSLQNTTIGIAADSERVISVVHNNVFYNNAEPIIVAPEAGAFYLNNIFHSPVTHPYPVLPVFSHNLFYGHTSDAYDPHKLTANPQFVNPGTGTDGRNTVAGYQVQASSPVVNAGVRIPNPGARDFWANPITAATTLDIGAHEVPSGWRSPRPPQAVTRTIEVERFRKTLSSEDKYENWNDAGASGGKLTRFSANAVGDYIEIEYFVAEPGTYSVQVKGKTSTDRGTYQLSIDGVNQGAPVDLYSTTVAFPTASLGAITFSQIGVKKFRFTNVAKNPASTSHLLALDAIVLTNPPAASSTDEYVIDNASAAITGTWNPSNVMPNYLGTNYLFKAGGTGSAHVTWRPTLTQAGNYTVYYRIPDGDSTRPWDARFSITHSGGTTNYQVNQTVTPGGHWLRLGTHHFPAGNTGYVRLTDQAQSSQNVIADAVKFIAVSQDDTSY